MKKYFFLILPLTSYICGSEYTEIQPKASSTLSETMYLQQNKNIEVKIYDTMNAKEQEIPCSVAKLKYTKKNLPKIKKDIFGIQTLYLNNKNLKSLKGLSKLVQKLKLQDITGLILDDNNLTFIDQTIFSTLPKLRYLSLENNKITSIRTSDSKELDHDITINLKMNPIKEISADFFKPEQLSCRLYVSSNNYISENEVNTIRASIAKKLETKEMYSKEIIKKKKFNALLLIASLAPLGSLACIALEKNAEYSRTSTVQYTLEEALLSCFFIKSLLMLYWFSFFEPEPEIVLNY